MIYGEHDVARGVQVFATMGDPGALRLALLGISVSGECADLTRAEVERLRDLCEEALR